MKTFKATKDFVLLSVFVSIILLLSLIPQIGYVTILPGVSLTLVHIPVLVGIFLFRKLKPSIILGLAFGISSLIAAFMYAASPFDLAFQVPWIPIIPRLLFAIAAYYLIVLFEKVETIKHGKHILFTLVSVITALGLFFGLKTITQNVAVSAYNTAMTNYNTNLVSQYEKNTLLEQLVKENNIYLEMIDFHENNLNNNTYEDVVVNKINSDITLLNAKVDLNNETISNIYVELPILISAETNLKDIYNLESNKLESKINTAKIVNYVLSGVLIILFLTVYFIYTYIKDKAKTYMTSGIILSTLTHTLLVILTVALFNPEAFRMTFGNNNSAIYIMYSLAVTNGLIEALVAVFVTVPIVLVLSQLKESDEV